MVNCEMLSIGENNFQSIQLQTFHCLRFKELSDKMRLKSTAFYQCGRYFWKYNFRANFGVLSLEFDVKALVLQGLTRSPNYFGHLNNFMTLIVCESLREIGEMACVTPACSSRGQTWSKKWVNPLTAMSDQDRISRYNINTISGRQVMRIKKNITLGIISWSNTELSKLTL